MKKIFGTLLFATVALTSNMVKASSTGQADWKTNNTSSETAYWSINKGDIKGVHNLKNVNMDLVRVLAAVKNKGVNFAILEGQRNITKSEENIENGNSSLKNPTNSRHIYCEAIDVAPITDDGTLSFDWLEVRKLAKIIKHTAYEMGVNLKWGGDWKHFKDGLHYQINEPLKVAKSKHCEDNMNESTWKAVKESFTQ